MFQIGDHVMLKENEENDYLSEYYGQVFEVKGIDHIDGTREAFIDVENGMIKTSWFPERLEKINEVEPIEFNDVMNLL